MQIYLKLYDNFHLNYWHLMTKYRKYIKLELDLNTIIKCLASPPKFAEFDLTGFRQSPPILI